jgi:hypothetical protein
LYASKAESRYRGTNTAIFCLEELCANEFVRERKNKKRIDNANFNLTLLSLSLRRGRPGLKTIFNFCNDIFFYMNSNVHY